MNAYYFTFRSITNAQLGISALSKAGISAKLVRAPSTINSRGCAYAVSLPEQLKTKAKAILLKSGIFWEKEFIVSADGSAREVLI